MTSSDSDGNRDGMGAILEVSRRHVSVLTQQGEVVAGTISSKAFEIATGDSVAFETRGGRVFVTEVSAAKRCLFRSYRKVVKRMGANIDHLFVISAVDDNLNPLAIDRMLIAARIEKIPVSLVMNKADRGIEHVKFITEAYEKIGIRVIPCSAKADQGLQGLNALLDSSEVKIAALCGVSGVGKSTILNRLVPLAKTRTGDLSKRTGQGKQTTTQPRGFLYETSDFQRKIVVDFPGVQFFGLSHIELNDLNDAFDEFRELQGKCRFMNCRHLQEPECAVRDRVESGAIAPWRYQSYLQIIQEIDDAKEY